MLKRLASATIERILKQFTRDDVPELVNFVSGVSSDDGSGSIPDGVSYVGTLDSPRPDFIQKELSGWE